MSRLKRSSKLQRESRILSNNEVFLDSSPNNAHYRELKGYSYRDEQVDAWLKRNFLKYLSLHGTEKVLDLCGGDGVWAFGLLRKYPQLEITSVDISSAAISEAKSRSIQSDLLQKLEFLQYDLEDPLPFEEESFDLVFARGVFVFNQHEMTSQGTLNLLQHWHSLLRSGGRFVSMYGSNKHMLGFYSPASTTLLPGNSVPRRTKSVDFRGGKFNHTPMSFLAPFLKLQNVQPHFYKFESNRHTLITMPYGN